MNARLSLFSEFDALNIRADSDDGTIYVTTRGGSYAALNLSIDDLAKLRDACDEAAVIVKAREVAA